MDASFKLTKQTKLELKRLGLSSDEIIALARADMDLDANFVDSTFLLFKDRLVHLAQKASETKFYRGTLKNVSSPQDYEIACRVFLHENIASADVFKEVVGGRFYISPKSGESEILALFSSGFTAEVKHLSNLYSKLLKGEKLETQDLLFESSEKVCPKCRVLYPDSERAVCPKCLDKRSIFVRSSRFVLQHKKHVVWLLVVIGLMTGLSLVTPYLAGTVFFDNIIAQNENFVRIFTSSENINWYIFVGLVVLAMIFANILTLLFQYLRNRIVGIVIPHANENMKNTVFKSISKLSMKFYTSKKTGSLLNRVLQDTERVADFYVNVLPLFLTSTLTMITALVLMLLLSWQLSLFTLIMLPLLGIVMKRGGAVWHRVFQNVARKERALSSKVNDNITGARVVRVFGQQQDEIEKFEKKSQGLYDAEVQIPFQGAKVALLNSLIFEISYRGIWTLGAFLITYNVGGLTYGTIVTFAMYAMMMQGPLGHYVHMLIAMNRSLTAAGRMFEIIDANPTVLEDKNPLTTPILGEIEFKDVHFAYDTDRDILKGIDLKIGKGQNVGIIGKTGAGKSTFANLLLRLYDTTSGNIEIDCVNIKKYAFKTLRDSIAIVSQETYIFMGSVLDNIRYKNKNATLEECIKAAKAANAHDFIMELEDGYDTAIGAAHRALSGGQKQRISIARAILANPKILVLDEATASVDVETEFLIQTALDKLTKNRTTITIAHRLSTLKNADMLAVFSGGKIIEKGTHDELMAKKGEFYKLYELQRQNTVEV